MLAPLSALLSGSRASRALLFGMLLCGFASSAHAAAPEPRPRAATAVCAEGQIAATPAPRVDRTAEPLRDEEPAWCVSADDPRCAPLHKDGAHHTLALRIAAAAEAFAPALPAPPPAKAHDGTPSMGPRPCVGVSHRVERPPRASRQPS